MERGIDGIPIKRNVFIGFPLIRCFFLSSFGHIGIDVDVDVDVETFFPFILFLFVQLYKMVMIWKINRIQFIVVILLGLL